METNVMNEDVKKMIDDCNRLAHKFVELDGWTVADKNMKMYKSKNKRARTFWNRAVLAYQHIYNIDINYILTKEYGTK